MAYINSSFQSQPSMSGTSNTFSFNHAPINNSFLVRIGQREVSVCRDFRKRFYPTNPIIECRAGVSPGHVEILLMRSWLIVFSRAQA